MTLIKVLEIAKITTLLFEFLPESRKLIATKYNFQGVFQVFVKYARKLVRTDIVHSTQAKLDRN